ncbi:MAG TPA: PIG-L deacetylase family protein [Microlunatus sp.]
MSATSGSSGPVDRRDPAWADHVTASPRPAGRRPRRQPAPGVPDGVMEVRPWPPRTALLIAEEPYPTAVDALRRVGFSTVRVEAPASADRIAELDPFTYVLIGPEVLGRPGCLDLLDALRSLSPVARFLLLSDGDVDPPILLAAIRAGVQEVVDPLDQITLLTTLRVQLERSGRTRERVLAVGAHPDDVEIGCAGTLLEHRRQGDRISVLTLSRGAVGGDSADRTDEAADAATLLGAQLLLADLPDTRVSAGIQTITIIEDVVEALDPTIVYVHSAHDIHQDHRAVHAATTSAARTVPTVMAYQSPSADNGFVPTAFVPIDRVVDRKVDVLACHVSQAGRSYLDPETVVSTARYWGRRIATHARFAEPFEVLHSIDRVGGPLP